jgi:hypothetical protein
MLLGVATNVVGIVVMLRQVRRIRGGHRLVARSDALAVIQGDAPALTSARSRMGAASDGA